MAGHGSAPPPDRGAHPGRVVTRKAYGEGGPHPSLSDAQVEGIRQQTSRNALWRQHDPDTIAEGQALNREPREDY